MHRKCDKVSKPTSRPFLTMDSRDKRLLISLLSRLVDALDESEVESFKK